MIQLDDIVSRPLPSYRLTSAAIGPDLDRRDFMKLGGSAILGTAVIGAGAATVGCGPSKEEAVKVLGFVADLTSKALPLLDLLGAHDIAQTLQSKGIPALDKLKTVLTNAEIPQSRDALATLQSILDGVGDALLNLPASPRRTTIIGILASINALLLTVEAFVGSEMLPQAKPETLKGIVASAFEVDAKSARMLKVFEATRQ